MFSVHSDVVWPQEHTCDLVKNSSRYVQILHSEIIGSLHGQLECIWDDKRTHCEPLTDVRKISTTSYLVEYEEVCILCSIWDSVGTYCMQGSYVGRSCQYYGNCQPTNINDIKKNKGGIGSHRILLEVHKGMHIYRDSDGETVEEGCKVRME